MQKAFTLLFFAFLWLHTDAQFYQPVFPDLQGQTLLDSVKAYFKPQTVLDYSMARDTMFSKIYLEGDSVFCVYSRHGLKLPPNIDPTVNLWMNGAADGINCEHSYPQSMGAGNGNAKSDMHHLFPSRAAVNDARGNQTFGDVVDSQAQKWYFKNQSMTTIPTVGLDNYSEKGAVDFEVREAQKGNTARAMLYFYTIYKAEADAADPNYFQSQRAAICAWQDLDPVDSLEWVRTWKIANYQEGKPNPFVLDCTLAARTWCADFSATCNTIGTDESKRFSNIVAFPNPTSGRVNLKMTIEAGGVAEIAIFDFSGKQVGSLSPRQFPAGSFDLEVPFDLSPGLYSVRMAVRGERRGFATKLLVL